MVGFVKGLGERALHLAGLPLRWAGAQLAQGRAVERRRVMGPAPTDAETEKAVRQIFGLECEDPNDVMTSLASLARKPR